LEGCIYYGRLEKIEDSKKNKLENMLDDNMWFVDYMMPDKPVVKEGAVSSDSYPSRISEYLKRFEKKTTKQTTSTKKLSTPLIDHLDLSIGSSKSLSKAKAEYLENIFVEKFRENEKDEIYLPQNRIGPAQIYTLKIDLKGERIVMGGVSGVGSLFLKE
jgi:hypothetical protein